MNIQCGLPSTLTAGGVTVSVRTGAAFWIWLSSRMREAEGGPKATSILLQSITAATRGGVAVSPLSLSQDEGRAVLSRLMWFMRGGVEEEPPKGKPAKERLLDYERDIDALYAAFLHAYGIDLYAEDGDKPVIQTMHWWRFLALVGNLPPGSTLVDHYMHYRGLDVSKLPRKTAADRKYLSQVIEIKRQVSLDGRKAAKRATREPAYVTHAKELQARK